jgi:hypothetical protein
MSDCAARHVNVASNPCGESPVERPPFIESHELIDELKVVDLTAHQLEVFAQECAALYGWMIGREVLIALFEPKILTPHFVPTVAREQRAQGGLGEETQVCFVEEPRRRHVPAPGEEFRGDIDVTRVRDAQREDRRHAAILRRVGD